MKAAIVLALAVVATTSSGCATQAQTGSARADPPASPAPVQTASPEPSRSGGAAAPSARDGDGSEVDTATLPSVDLSPQLLFQLLAADLAAQRGEAGAAWSTYMAVARQTRDPRIARRATEVATGARALDESIQAAQLWRELDPGSHEASQTLELMWLSAGRLQDVEPMLAERLAAARAAGTLPAAYGALQRTLQRVPDRSAAWRLLQRLSATDLDVAAARLARANLAAAAEDHPAALAEAREAMRLAPDDESAAIAAARSLERQPDGRGQALALLDGFLGRVPGATDARLAHARLLLADGQAEPARAQLERVLASNPDSAPVLFTLAQLSYQGKQPAQARTYLERYLDLPRSVRRDDAPALLFLSRIAEEQGRLDEAIDWLARVPRGENFVPATVRRAVLTGKSGQVQAALDLLRDAPAATVRERVLLLSGEAQVLREARRSEEAFEVLAKGLERLPDNPELLYDYAMAAERLDRLPVMETSLRRLIELRPDYAHAYNALGYTFADRNIRLDEARTLIEKAVSLAPDDAHILDSLGWVLFRQKDYPRALEALRKAYDMLPEAEIAAHLGEVLWTMGRTDEAKAVWREARGRDPDNTTLRDTLSRLDVTL